MSGSSDFAARFAATASTTCRAYDASLGRLVGMTIGRPFRLIRHAADLHRRRALFLICDDEQPAIRWRHILGREAPPY